MTRLVPDQYDDDTVFLYASRVVHDRDRDRWELHVDPDDCLAGAVGPSIQGLQDVSPSVEVDGRCRVYDGPMLFSAGVIFIVGDQHVLLRRGEKAPTDPGKWTSPAGRCEHDPGTTALEEFYEELVITARERPVFVTRNEDRSTSHVETYETTLVRVGIDASREAWHRLDGSVPELFRGHLSTIVTHYGDRVFTDEMLAYYAADVNTLELRFVLQVNPPSDLTSELSFHDGEFDRTVDLFDRETLRSMPTSKLVPTDAYLASEVLPELMDEE